MLIKQLLEKNLLESQLESLSSVEMTQLIGGIAWLAEQHGLENLTTSQILAEFHLATACRVKKNSN